MSNWTAISERQPDELLKVSEAAKRVGVSQDTIRRSYVSGSLPAHKIRGCVRIRLGELDEWLEAQRYQARESVTETVTLPVATDYRW